MKNHIVMALIAFLICPASFLAGQDTTAAAPLASGSATKASPDAVVVSADASASPRDLINVNFPNNEIRNILRSVAELKNLNVVIPDTIAGKMSIKLSNVTWQQVYEVVLEPIGYTYIQDGNIIKIRSIKDLMAEPMQTRVFIISYARAAELCPSIIPIVDAHLGGRAIIDTRTNAIVVTERSSRIRQIEEIIKRLDRPTEQVMIETKFIEVTDNKLSDVGIDWSSLKGLTGSATLKSSITGTYDNNINDASPNLDTDYERINTAVLSTNTFNLVLNALQSDERVTMVSNPTIVTMNNVPASIHIGEEYPIPNYQYNETQGSYEISGFEYKPIGINMDVTPLVNNNGLISLQVQPEISSQSGTVTFGGASGADIPIITQRKTSSTVTIKSGYTLAIGGLIQSTNSGSNSRVPYLGRIPLLGRLFRNDSTSGDKRNLVIFITAKILDPEGSTYKDVIAKQTISDMGITDDDIPGNQLSGDQVELYERLQKARNDRKKAETEARMRLELQKTEQGK
jgi:type IV pilus assembly protein PilQ